MRLWIIALLLAPFSLTAISQTPVWSLPLNNLGLARFDRDPVTRWVDQQGALFLTPDRLLVYQAKRSQEPPRLGPREPSGGAGNFLLNIRVLSAGDGRLIKELKLVTNAAISQILATHDGRFLIRTGNVIFLYSADFSVLASRELKLAKQTEREDWQIGASPLGRQIVLLHEQIFSEPEILADGSLVHDGKAKVDIEIVDGDTLERRASFALEHTLVFWSPAEGFLVSSNPAHSYSDHQVGSLDFTGHWLPLKADFKLPKSSCGYSANALDKQMIVVLGCETFTVLSVDGQRIFSRNDGRFVFVTARASGSYLAFQCNHYSEGMTLPVHSSELTAGVDRIQVFDVEKRKLVLSYRLHSAGAYYAVSSRGDLAVVDGDTLSLSGVEP